MQMNLWATLSGNLQNNLNEIQLSFGERNWQRRRWVHIYVVRMLCKIFPTIRIHISVYFDSFVWNSPVYCYLKSLFASLGCAFYGFLLGYFIPLEYKRKVKFPDTTGQAKEKQAQSKTILMLTATTTAKAQLRWLSWRFAGQQQNVVATFFYIQNQTSFITVT